MLTMTISENICLAPHMDDTHGSRNHLPRSRAQNRTSPFYAREIRERENIRDTEIATQYFRAVGRAHSRSTFVRNEDQGVDYRTGPTRFPVSVTSRCYKIAVAIIPSPELAILLSSCATKLKFPITRSTPRGECRDVLVSG